MTPDQFARNIDENLMYGPSSMLLISVPLRNMPFWCLSDDVIFHFYIFSCYCYCCWCSVGDSNDHKGDSESHDDDDSDDSKWWW